MAKNKFDRNNKNNTKGQETMGAKIEDTAVATAAETEEEIIPADGIETEQVGSLGDNGVADSENLVPAPEFKEGVDVEPKVDESEDGGEDMDMEAKVLESELDASKVEEPEESSEIEKEDLYLFQTPSLVDTDAETKTQLEDSTYPPVATEDTDEFKVKLGTIDTDTIDTTTLLFNKKTINELILNYMEGDIVLDENTSILNSEENQRARNLIKTLNTINTGGGDKIETKILSYLSLYMEPTDTPKSPGMLMQLIAKEINEAKTISDLDMAIFILTRIFTNVASFNIRSFLKIGNDYSAAFKVDALQMVEAFSQLSTADDRKKKIGTIVSLQKAFKASTSFLTANGARLMIEYFSK